MVSQFSVKDNRIIKIFCQNRFKFTLNYCYTDNSRYSHAGITGSYSASSTVNIMILNFYSYEECFRHYTKSITNLKQNKLNGKINIAKPALLLTVMQLIDQCWLRSNRIILTNGIEKWYGDLYHQYDLDKNVTPIYYPFYHLESDGFWHIRWTGAAKTMDSPSRRFIDDNIEYVFLDEDLWILLQHQDWRRRLMDFIIKEKLSASQ